MKPEDQPSTPAETQPDSMVTSPDEPAAVSPYAESEDRKSTTTVTYAPKFNDDEDSDTEARLTDPVDISQPVDWQAKEYIAPDKNAIWYTCLGLVVVAVILLDIFYVHSYTLTALIIAIAVVLIVMSVRPARIIKYTLTMDGLYIGEQLVDLTEYKSFGVIHDGKENSLFLTPIKRFKPGLSIYFPLESGESIVDNLGERLPMQEIKLDFIDNIVRLLRL